MCRYPFRSNCSGCWKTRSFERVGENINLGMDARLITATNQNLNQLVREKQFREDFFYRINVIPVHLPPLRERKEDLPCWWITSSI